jgi:biotin operon repressor
MTTTRFDAPAPSTRALRYPRPAHACAGALAFRLVRLVWLTARFARRELVSIDDYRRRFGMSLRSFHRDVGVLRQAGFEIEPVVNRTYRMVCFTFDSDCAS